MQQKQHSPSDPAGARSNDWLTLRRTAAQSEYSLAPIPPRGLHLWRYTDPEKFISTDTAPATAGDNYDDLFRARVADVAAGRTAGIVRDSQGVSLELNLAKSVESLGIVVTSLSQAVVSHRAIVEKHLYGLINSHSGKFEAQNGAQWREGIFIYIPKGVTAPLPLELMRVAPNSGTCYPRLLVVAEDSTTATIFDEYLGGPSDDSGTSLSNAAVEIYAGANSHIRYIQLQHQAEGSRLYLTHRGQIGRDSTMLTIPLCLGAGLAKQNFGVLLNGEGAHSNMIGLLFGMGRQHADNHTLHHHLAGRTTSNIEFKVALRDKALSAYTGLIRIEKGARTCEAYQENRNLLLNAGTKAETIPELEILNEDVKCTHGAAIGPIDPMSIFYLKARGVHHAEAVRMIVGGFIESTLKQFPEDLRARIDGVVEEKLSRL